VQEWEAGKIKPQGEDYTLWGGARIDQRVTASGFEGGFGSHAVGPSANALGFEAGGIGTPVFSYADGAEFVCGRRSRAIAVPEGPGPYVAFGTPVFEGWGFVEEGYYEEGYAP
jgi:hypothetical protein